jgi:hypothetical protein
MAMALGVVVVVMPALAVNLGMGFVVMVHRLIRLSRKMKTRLPLLLPELLNVS